MEVSLKKDKKGSCWIISHKRCGFTECLFMTKAELIHLAVELKKVLSNE